MDRGAALVWPPACHAGEQMGSNPIRSANLVKDVNDKKLT